MREKFVGMQVAWHFRHDVVALLTGTAANAGPSTDTGKSEGGFFSRKKVLFSPFTCMLFTVVLA